MNRGLRNSFRRQTKFLVNAVWVVQRATCSDRARRILRRELPERVLDDRELEWNVNDVLIANDRWA